MKNESALALVRWLNPTGIIIETKAPLAPAILREWTQFEDYICISTEWDETTELARETWDQVPDMDPKLYRSSDDDFFPPCAFTLYALGTDTKPPEGNFHLEHTAGSHVLHSWQHGEGAYDSRQLICGFDFYPTTTVP